MSNPVVHFEICVKDMDAGIDFYRNLFGWEITKDQNMTYAMIRTGEDPEGGIFPAEGDMKPFVTVYAKVEDIDAVLDKAERMGAFIIQRKKLITEQYGYYGMFADPDGNVIGLWSKT